jgi:hypothetical protein
LHASHVPHDEVEQQTPSTHESPVRQSLLPVHVSPRRCWSPQEFFSTSQIAGATQSPSVTQVVPQAVPLQV